MAKWLIAVFISFTFFGVQTSCAQTNAQMWDEYMLNYPFANNFNLENAFAYSTVLGTPKWRAYDYSACLEWSVTQHIDLIAQSVFSYTNQTDSYNTFEIRPILGTRIHFTPNKRVLTRLLLREELRNFKNLETGEWTNEWRPRIRAEALIPINRKSYFEDKLWYGITDVEWLFKTDIEERFANRFRYRIGVGYRFSYNLRVEFIYMLQLSKNQIGEDFETNDNIFRFRVKQYLRKSKPAKAEGTGG
jgi:hypothetical protein